MNNVGLVDVDIGEIVKSIHSTRSKVLVGQRRFRSQAFHGADVVEACRVVKIIPVQVYQPLNPLTVFYRVVSIM